jgi:murein DD-endopeptidase MepM/ murein hydrolase activator NlpD
MSAKPARVPEQSNSPKISLNYLLCLAIAAALVILTVVSSASSPAAATSGGSSSPRPLWQSPVGPPDRPSILRGFDPPAQRWLAGHRGVDLAATPGQLVRSAGPGEVTYASRIADRGVVVVSHGLLRTTYEPVDASVTVGSNVMGGDVLGTVGPGGHCNARCLHWGLRRGEQYLDPLLLLNQQPPVLKPTTTRLTGRTLNSRSKRTESAHVAMGSSRAAVTTSAVGSQDSTTVPSAPPQQSAAGTTAPNQAQGAGVLVAAVAIGAAAGVRSVVKRR